MDDEAPKVNDQTEEIKTPISTLLNSITVHLEEHGLDEFKHFLTETFDKEELAELIQYFIVMRRANKGLKGSPTQDPREPKNAIRENWDE